MIKVLVYYAKWLGPEVTFYDVGKKDQIISFLKLKEKSLEEDPERTWITTWNDYLGRIKIFFRGLYNWKEKNDGENALPMEEWEIPEFTRIRSKKTKRLSPYSISEIWTDVEDLYLILKYETNPRNKAAIMFQWDADARNHEVTLVRIKNIRFREKYDNGENAQDWAPQFH